MTDKKFKEQLINLIKNDTEVRALVFEIAKEEIEDLLIETFYERESEKSEKILSEKHLEKKETIADKIDSYFYLIAREIEHNRRSNFYNSLKQEAEIEYEQNFSALDKEYNEEKEYQQKVINSQNEYLKSIPRHQLDKSRLTEIYNYLVTNKMMEGSFFCFSHFCSMYGGKYDLNWIDTKGYNNKNKKIVCYPLLFDLMHNIVFNEKKIFTKRRRKIFLTSISEGMKFGGKYVNYDSLNTAYSDWVNKYSLTDKI
ncbi:hypothetical protein [Myroides odoratimimus]|uniref:hypothetical protein n=1 Tax=Myroides odoratimimus TaxID=76832 RepID=UPI0025769309|nr:hypothetical protein [Myroides odoratimimus]MDM1452778.1 hypothetical protein [Myroides odoratimimus]MDM1476353.1 hypothetical protein [Myroides odoratimimus]MDM1488880.1 hypothetical protein [Myroides odoratimimus]